MQSESFGARLRTQRERQDVTLAAIAEQTKIKVTLWEGLERDDISHWPEGIFRRAYVRAYARAIGLEPDVVVREFLEVYPEPVAVVPDNDADRPVIRLRYLVDSAIGALSGIRLRRDHGHEPAPPPEAAPAAADPPVQQESSSLERDLAAVANLCTRLARVAEPREVWPVLHDAATILDAAGLILWIWNPQAAALGPVLAHGYPEKLLAQLPAVGREADNAIAAAFRSAEPCVVNGSEAATGAVVVPVMTPEACVGVLALELQHGGEQREWIRAVAVILAAQLATLIGSTAMAEAVNA